jgi:hypothetical protein
LDRIYFSHDFIIKLIRDYAQKSGIVLRKKQNDATSINSFVAMKDIKGHKIKKNKDFISSSLQIKVPATRWHKKGAPYLDTFYSLCLFENGNFYLRNSEDNDCFATCRQTTGYASKKRNLCPACGILHSSNDSLCENCADNHRVDTAFGKAFFGRVRKYNWDTYPCFLFKRGRPKPTLRRYLQIKKLYLLN